MPSPTFSFFTKNRINSGSTFVMTSAPSISTSALFDRKRTPKLTSVGSDDVTDEVWQITFTGDVAKDISAILIDNHNIKSGNVKYWNGSSYVDFSPAISLSGNSDETSFFSFPQVSTSRLQFTFSTTFVVDAQKYVGEIMAFDLIGTPSRPPASFVISQKERSVIHETANGGNVYVFFGKKSKIKLTFSDASYSDIDLFLSLKELGDVFFIYPSGGEYEGVDIGLRMQDIYQVNYVNDFSPNLKSNILELNQSLALELQET
jgi:hypothetical protein